MFKPRSIRARLLAAFYGISVFAVLAAVAAMTSFSGVSRSLDQITERRVPPALASQDLVLHVERMLAAAPVVLQVTTEAEYETVSAKITEDVARLYQLLEGVDPSGAESQRLSVIQSLVERLELNLIQLQAIAFNNLSLVEQRRGLLRQLFFTQSQVEGLLEARLVVLEGQVAALRRSLDSGGDGTRDPAATTRALISAIEQQRPLEQLRFLTARIIEQIVKAASAESRQDLLGLAHPLALYMQQLDTKLSHFDVSLQESLADSIEQLQGFASGRDSLLLMRERELDSVQGQEQLSKNADIVEELTDALQQMVIGAKSDIAQASAQARRVQRFGAIALLAVVGLSLVSSALIVGLYVDRNLLARLDQLKQSMLAIAAGNLRAHIPEGQTDEIGDMAEALTVFRDTAVEVEDGHLREIAAARQQLADAIESISDGFAIYDRDDRLVLSNTPYRRLLRRMAPGRDIGEGTSFETIIRSVAEHGLLPIDPAETEAWIAERMVRHREPAEPYVQELSNGVTYRVTENRTTEGGWVVVYTDITELVRAERELREILETSPLAVSIVRGNRFLFANSRLAELARTTRADVLASDVTDAYAEPASLAGVIDEVEREGVIGDVEVRLNRADGTNFWGLLWAQRVTYQGKKVHVGWTSDITERKEAEVALREAKEAAESANRTKSQFLANMSHELRTPLNAILGYTELIADDVYGEVPEKIREALGRVERNGRQLLGHINDVLDLSKIEAGQFGLTLEEYSLTDLVETVRSGLESLAAEKSLTLIAILPERLPLGRGDEHRLTQVLTNLVGNAVKFTEHGGIEITAEQANGSFTVAVRDSGPGIEPDDQQRIFEEFNQADSSNTRRAGGTGLGLAIARRIVELHQGQMWVESTLGEGSTFAFSIPVRVARA